VSTTGIIIRREYWERLKSRSFIIGTALVVLGIFGLGFVPLLGPLLDRMFTPKIVIVAPDQTIAKSIAHAIGDSYDTTISSEAAQGSALPQDISAGIKSKKYDAALVAYRTSSGLAFTFYPRQANLLEKTGSLRARLVPIAVDNDLSGTMAMSAKRALNFDFKTVPLNERYKSENEEVLAGGLVYVLLILLYIATILYGVQVAQGVIEEKANRIMEVMIGAVRPSQLLAGKIFGIGALALTQMVIFALASAGAAVVLAMVVASIMTPNEAANLAHRAATAQASMPGGAMGAPNVSSTMVGAIPLATLIYVVVFFLLGFFSYAALFAGVGALCSRAEDVQQYNGVIMIPIIGAYFVATIALAGDPDKPFVVVASMIPLLSPMVMFTRVALSSVPLWQVGLSIALSVAAIWGLTLLAAKLYRVGVLMYGKPPKLSELWRAVRAPT
jgi:ABC-2 type transport system permease protein